MKIEKNIPVSEFYRNGLTNKCKFMIENMEVGDSVLLNKKERLSIRSMLDKLIRIDNLNLKFTIRRVEDDNYRCWRVE